MIDPIAVGQTKEYILISEREQKDEKGNITKPADDNPTIWLIGPIDSMEQARIMSLQMEFDVVEGKTVAKRNKDAIMMADFTIVKHGLKGFRNFGNAEFKTEKFKFFDHEKEVVSDETIKLIHPDIIRELADVILSSNQVDEGLRKN